MELGGASGTWEGGRGGPGDRLGALELFGEVPSGFQKALRALGSAGLGALLLPPYSTVSGLEDLKPILYPSGHCFQRAAAFCCKRGPPGFLR